MITIICQAGFRKYNRGSTRKLMKLTEYIIPVISLSLCIPKAKLTSDVDK